MYPTIARVSGGFELGWSHLCFTHSKNRERNSLQQTVAETSKPEAKKEDSKINKPNFDELKSEENSCDPLSDLRKKELKIRGVPDERSLSFLKDFIYVRNIDFHKNPTMEDENEKIIEKNEDGTKNNVFCALFVGKVYRDDIKREKQGVWQYKTDGNHMVTKYVCCLHTWKLFGFSLEDSGDIDKGKCLVHTVKERTSHIAEEL